MFLMLGFYRPLPSPLGIPAAMGAVGLEPTMPEGDWVTASCVTNSAHTPLYIVI